MALTSTLKRRLRLAFYLCLAGGAAVAQACGGSTEAPAPEPDPDAGDAGSSGTDASVALDAGPPPDDGSVIIVDARPEDADLWDVICE